MSNARAQHDTENSLRRVFRCPIDITPVHITKSEDPVKFFIATWDMNASLKLREKGVIGVCPLDKKESLYVCSIVSPRLMPSILIP